MTNRDSTLRAGIKRLRARLDELESQLSPEFPAHPSYCDFTCSSCRGEPCEYPGHCWEPLCIMAAERARKPEPGPNYLRGVVPNRRQA